MYRLVVPASLMGRDLVEARKIARDPMTPIRIVKGLVIPIAGAPDPTVADGTRVSPVALLGGDAVGLGPIMRIDERAKVILGQPLFVDRRHPEIVFAAPGSGVDRGARRSLRSVVVDAMLTSGLWTALRQRPNDKIPPPDAVPSSIFVTPWMPIRAAN